MRKETGFGRLLADSHFQALLWTQFLGDFLIAVVGSRYRALAGVIFVIPFLLFAGYAGQIADRFSKTRVLQVTAFFGIVALLAARIEVLALFLLAMQATFFSPAKYGILPEVMPESQISRANGLLALTAFAAIVAGTGFGTFFGQWKLLAIAVACALASLHVWKVPAVGAIRRFRGNPFHEVIEGSRDLRAHPALARSVFGISWFWFICTLGILYASETHSGLAAFAAGIGIGSMAAGVISVDHIELGLVPLGSLLMAIFSISLGVTHSRELAMISLAGLGFSAGLFAVPLNAFLQERADPALRGRILATNNFYNVLGVILAWGLFRGNIMLALGVVMLFGVVYVVRLMPDILVRFVLWWTMTTLFRVRVEGRENIPRTGGALLVANHISYADSVLVGQCTPRIPRFLMWRPIFNTPGVKFFFELLHAIPISPESPKSTIHALSRARAELEAGQLVAIFPEGSVTRSGEIETFQRGFERIVVGLDTPIIPMHITGLWGHPFSTKGGKVFGSWEKVWRPVVDVRIGEPVYGPISPAELREIVLDLAPADMSESRAMRS